MEFKTLNNGLKMPMVGLGVYNIPERETQRVVEDAICVGYRSIDTAAMYYNEKGVGDAVRTCGDDLREIHLLDTGRNVTGWPSDALRYNPEST